MRKIGLAKELNGLYYLKCSKVKINACVHSIDIDPSRLWNLRLGHLSHDRTRVLIKGTIKFLFWPKHRVMYVIWKKKRGYLML